MLSDYLGRRMTLVLGWFVFALAFAAFAFASSIWTIAGVLVIYALHYALTEGTERALVADIAPARSRGFAFGVFHGTIGLGALPASLIFGAIADAQTLRVAFLVSATTAFVAALLLLLVVRVGSSTRAKAA
jgi:MFS family permease